MSTPYITGSGFMDRPELFITNLLSGHLKAAAKAAIPGTDLDSFSLEERKKLSDKLGLTGTVMAPVVDVITNPMVLIPLAATLLTKLPTAGMINQASTSDAWSRFSQSWIPILSSLAPAFDRFKGTKLPAMGERVLRDTKNWHSKWFGDSGAETAEDPGFITEWKQALNNRGKELSPEDLKRLTIQRAALNERGAGGHSEIWEVQAGMLKNALKQTDPEKKAKAWALVNGGLPESEHITPEMALDLLKRMQNPMPGFKADPTLNEAEAALKKIFDKVHADAFAKKENVEDILLHSPNVFPGADTWSRDDLIAEALKQGEYQERFAPMISRLGPGEKGGIAWIKANRRGGASVKRYNELLEGAAERQGTARVKVRENGMIPDPQEFLDMGGDPVIAEYLKKRVRQGDRTFTLDMGYLLPRYLDNMSRTMAFSVRNSAGNIAGDIIEEEMKLLRAGEHYGGQPGHVQQQNAIFGDTVFVPTLRGEMTPTQMAGATAINAFKKTVSDRMRDPNGIFTQVMGPDGAKRWADGLDYSPAYTSAGASSRIASFLHNSTLWMNPVAASFNLLTIATNLAATVGLGSTTKGLQTAFKEIGGYMKLRGAGTEPLQAFAKAFPEFHAMSLELNDSAKASFADTLEKAYLSGFNTSPGNPATRVMTTLQKVNLFGSTEFLNRLTSFHASKDFALKTYNVGKDTWLDPLLAEEVPVTKENLNRASMHWAADNVSRTQFGSSILQKPGAIADWNPLLRQFTTFPLRTANMVARAPGPTLARLALASGATYAVAKQFGMDPSRGLLFGGLPQVTDPDFTPFAPFPLVTPALQIAGGAALAAVGKPEYLQRSLPLLVPGGVSAARGVGLIPGVGRHIAPLIGRQYVDDRFPTPDGRYPVYTSNQALVGYFSEPQLVGRAMGIPQPDQNAEAELTKMMVGNRDRISKMKRDYLDALFNNDAADAMRIREEYEEAYPNTGGLPIKKSDIRALHLRRDVGRMERVMDTLPPEHRQEFLTAIAVSMGANPAAFMGLQENGLRNGTTLDRDPYRAYTSASTGARVSEGLHGVDLREKMKAAGMGSAYEQNRDRDSGTYLMPMSGTGSENSYL